MTDTPPLAGDPTPDEIEAACVVIRSSWGPAETKRRRITLLDPLTAMIVGLDDVIGALAEV